MASGLRALRVVHPFPSLLNAALVLTLAVVAGATAATAVLLTVGMIGIQFCIGAVNDLNDVELDRRSKPWKPIPAGLLSVRTATAIAAAAATVAVIAPLTQGPIVASMALVMLGCGLLYDLKLKPTAWAWACFSVAFAILPIYAWYGVTATLPPLAQFVIPLAALAGPALQISNSVVDLEQDAAAGVATLATRLGRGPSLAVVAVLLIIIYGLAWTTLTVVTGELNPAVLAATLIAVVGLGLQSRIGVGYREVGWSLQACGIALLALGWLSAVA